MRGGAPRPGIDINSQGREIEPVQARRPRPPRLQPRNKGGPLELYFAAKQGDVNTVKTELAKGTNPNKIPPDLKLTPLYVAAFYGHLGVVKELLAHLGYLLENKSMVPNPTDPNLGNNSSGATPLYAAAGKGHLDIVKALLTHSKTDPNRGTYPGDITPLWGATQQGYLEIVEELLKHPSIDINKGTSDDGATPLYIATERRNLDIVKLLLANGANPNQARTTNGTTPVYIAAYDGNLDIVDVLLENGADPNQANIIDGATPVHVAAQEGYADVVRALLANGANPNKERTDTGTTPVFVAAQRGRLEVLKLLLANGANPNKARTDGTTPLQYAEMYGLTEIAAVLREVPNNNNIYSGSNESDNEEHLIRGKLRLKEIHLNLDTNKTYIVENNELENLNLGFNYNLDFPVQSSKNSNYVYCAIFDSGLGYIKGYVKINILNFKNSKPKLFLFEKNTYGNSEAQVVIIDDVEHLVTFTNNNSHSYISLINMENGIIENIEIPTRIPPGFHSIYYKN